MPSAKAIHARFLRAPTDEGDTLVMLDDDVIVQGDGTTLKPQQKAVAPLPPSSGA